MTENARAPAGPPHLAHLLGALDAFLFDSLLAIPKPGTLSLAHVDLLCWVGERGFVTWREARTGFGCPPAALARLVKGLARRRLLRRVRDPRDWRVVHLRLTGAGRALFFRIEHQRRRGCGRLLALLSAEERAVLAGALGLLTR